MCICLYITTLISSYFSAWPSHSAQLAFAISEWLCSLSFTIIYQLMNEAEYLMKKERWERRVLLQPRRITPSEISIILVMIRKPNSITVLLFIQNNSKFKNIAKTSIDVQFISDSVRLCLSSSANILQIADVALRVVFLLFLPCF